LAFAVGPILGISFGAEGGGWNFLIFFWLNLDPFLSLLELTPGKRRIAIIGSSRPIGLPMIIFVTDL